MASWVDRKYVALACLVVGLAAFSAFAFQQGAYRPGIIVAVCALLLAVVTAWSFLRGLIVSLEMGDDHLSDASPWVMAAMCVLIVVGVAFSAYQILWASTASHYR